MKDLDASRLLVAFLEEEKWIEQECEDMERKKESYHYTDIVALPYIRTIFRTIREKSEGEET